MIFVEKKTSCLVSVVSFGEDMTEGREGTPVVIYYKLNRNEMYFSMIRSQFFKEHSLHGYEFDGDLSLE